MTIQWSSVFHKHVPHPWLVVHNNIPWTLLLCPGKAIYPCYRESYQHNQAKVRIRNRVTRGTIASTEHHLTSTNNISWKCFFLLIQCASHSRKIVS